MAFAVADRVFEQSVFAGGTGAVSLTTVAVSGYRSFITGWGASATGWYGLRIGAQWETGLGTLNVGGTTLTRTTVFDGSSGLGVPVNFSAGTMDCWGDLPAAAYGIFPSTAASSSSATGAVTVAGGLGVGGDCYLGGNIHIPTTGAFFSGSNAIVNQNGNYTVIQSPATATCSILLGNAVDPSSYYRAGAAAGGNHNFQANGGAITGAQFSFGASLAVGGLAILTTTPSSSSTTGALTVAGGIGANGAIAAAATSGFLLGSTVALKNNGSNYHTLYDNAGVAAVSVGPHASDPKTYYDNDTHVFRTYGASIGIGTWDATKLAVLNTTASSSATTGALTVAGGLGVNGNISIPNGNVLNSGSSPILYQTGNYTTVQSPATAACTILLGNTSDPSNYYRAGTTSGGAHYFECNGGAFRGAAFSFGTSLASGGLSIYTTTASASSTTGALTVAGGLGVNESLYVNTYIQLGTSVTSFGCKIQIGYAGAGTLYGMGFRPAADTTNAIVFANAAGTMIGSISQTTTNTAFNTSSDGRLKEDKKSFNAGPTIDALQVYDFAWKVNGERSYGVVAQEVIDVFPQAVTHSADDCWGADYSKFVPLLLQELKDLRARVAALEAASNK